MPPVLGGAEKCPRCSQNVYFAEEVRAMGKKYHKLCLKCCIPECQKTLDSSNCNDHENDIYCNTCYRKNFGVHSATMTISTESGEAGEGTTAPPGTDMCFRCGKAVYMAERMAAGNNFFHKKCFKCNTCGVSLDSNRLTLREEEIYCKGCYGKNFGPKGYGFAGGASGLSMDTVGDETPTSHIPATVQAHMAPLMDQGDGGDEGSEDWTDDKDRCSRCRKVVFFAEKVAGVGRSYHKACFKCQKCEKSLDSTTLCEHEGGIYCKTCYSRNFGPKGFGFGTSMVSEQP